MQIESVSYSMSPERITTDPFDCLWLVVQPSSRRSPFQQPSLQWVDWRLMGRLSRYLKANPDVGAMPVYFPSRPLLNTPMVGLISSEHLDWQVILKACEGIGAKNIAIFFEDAPGAQSAKQALQRMGSANTTERITLAFDSSTA